MEGRKEGRKASQQRMKAIHAIMQREIVNNNKKAKCQQVLIYKFKPCPLLIPLAIRIRKILISSECVCGSTKSTLGLEKYKRKQSSCLFSLKRSKNERYWEAKLICVY
jgi:hypothetical protein